MAPNDKDNQTRATPAVQLAALALLLYVAGGADAETLVALVPYALQALAFVYVANLGNTPDAIIDDLEIPLPIVGNVLGDFVSGTVEAAAMAGNFGAYVLMVMLRPLFTGFSCGVISLIDWMPGVPTPYACKPEHKAVQPSKAGGAPDLANAHRAAMSHVSATSGALR